MPSIKSLATLLAVALVTANALPTADLESRQSVIGIKGCTDQKERGECLVVQIPLNNCYDIPSNFNDKFTSVRNLETGKGKCTWFEHIGCTGKKYQKDNDQNLQDGNAVFNNFISSVLCLQK
ncbi:hypothetical protein QBC34DRAFT_379156 [Podospora aff. communis PSN243]|uniref:Uncharacterized protein n=1 Tax=Podospora aff. communis PSN243 TaxID=3040156 RepID=A0AAV9GP99_9PEZI|nr:hypothetical protein QBC34DRAFT_379156 [Podospora aff. communis PSN243]